MAEICTSNNMFPLLDSVPTEGQWYRIAYRNLITANGKPYHAVFHCGTENKLLIFFFGGGCCWDAETAAHPIRPEESGNEGGFYFDEIDPYADNLSPIGIGSDDSRNPFRNWNALFLPYGSGDFHVGRAELVYITQDGAEQTAYLHGLENFQAAMTEVVRWVPEPERVLVAGSSAGGFGAALLSDFVLDYFPERTKAVCCVDGALLLNEQWHDIAHRVWNAPERIYHTISGPNMILDNLRALHNKRGGQMRCLLIHSVRDGMLGMFQAVIDGKPMVANRANADVFQRNLMEMWAEIDREIPTARLFLYDLPYHTPVAADGVTLHTIMQTPMAYECRFNGFSVVEWVYQAIDGDVPNVGLNLL